MSSASGIGDSTLNPISRSRVVAIDTTKALSLTLLDLRSVNPCAINSPNVGELASSGFDFMASTVSSAAASFSLAPAVKRLEPTRRAPAAVLRLARSFSDRSASARTAASSSASEADATHPTSPERSALASDRSTNLQWERLPGVARNQPNGYYGIVDGLILGDDPAGGLFDEENRFVHPELRFSIRFPQGWTTMNSQEAVAAISPSRDAQAMLTLEGSGTDIAKVVDEFIKREVDGIRVRVVVVVVVVVVAGGGVVGCYCCWCCCCCRCQLLLLLLE